jgi:hypothetical protein
MTGSLLYEKPKSKCRVLTEQKLDNTGAKHENNSCKFFRSLGEEIEVLKSSARTDRKLLKMKLFMVGRCEGLEALHLLRLFAPIHY